MIEHEPTEAPSAPPANDKCPHCDGDGRDPDVDYLLPCHGRRDDGTINYVDGANIAGFVKVADAMLMQGVI